ncbi:hypothetical protein BG004_006768 [Podila humilis]|nr:hypothetical protein BG004_006768 [Podila humilis]
MSSAIPVSAPIQIKSEDVSTPVWQQKGPNVADPQHRPATEKTHRDGEALTANHTAKQTTTAIAIKSPVSAETIVPSTQIAPQSKNNTRDAAVRKKRGLYKKTILRQQTEAIEHAKANGLPIPVFPPLDMSRAISYAQNKGKTRKGKSQQQQQQQQPGDRSSQDADNFQNQETRNHEQDSNSDAVERLDIRSHRKELDCSSEREAMERELAMLQEEADEDLRKREHETNRALMRAQVVNHLRSLRDDIDPFQLKIGHNLRIQSPGLFSEMINDVLGEIEKANSRELESFMNSLQSEPSLSSEATSSAVHSGHMLTRSSDKPHKQPKPTTEIHTLPRISSLQPPSETLPQIKPNPPKNGFHRHSTSVAQHSQPESHTPSQHHRRNHHVQQHYQKQQIIIDVDEEPYKIEIDSDEDTKLMKRPQHDGTKSSQFIGQSWDIAPEEGNSSMPIGKWYNSSNRLPAAHDLGSKLRPLSIPQKVRDINHLVRPVPRERESLQLRHRNELEQLQLLQRHEQEEFQRKQLNQLRDLQDRHSREFCEFEEEHTRLYRERLAKLTEKRQEIMAPIPPIPQQQHQRAYIANDMRSRKQVRSVLPSYEFSDGLLKQERSVSPARSISLSSSPSPTPSPPPSRSPSRSRSPSPSPSRSPSRQPSPPRQHSFRVIRGNPPPGNATAFKQGMMPPSIQRKLLMPDQSSSASMVKSEKQLMLDQRNSASMTKSEKTLQTPICNEYQQKFHQSRHEDSSSDIEMNLTNFIDIPLKSNASRKKRGKKSKEKETTVEAPVTNGGLAPYLSYAQPSTPTQTQRPLHLTPNKSSTLTSTARIMDESLTPKKRRPSEHKLEEEEEEEGPKQVKQLKQAKEAKQATQVRHGKLGTQNKHCPETQAQTTTKDLTGISFGVLEQSQNLLGHFNNHWSSGGTSDDLLEMVMRDPPAIEVAELESADDHASASMTGDFTVGINSNSNHGVNAALTSSGYMWYQEQHQQLARDMSTPTTAAMAPMTLGNFVASTSSIPSRSHTAPNGALADMNTAIGNPSMTLDISQSNATSEQLISAGEDPLSSYIFLF